MSESNENTSREAFESVSIKALEAMVYRAILKFGPEGCISDEVREMFPGFSYSSITARYAALYRKGFISYNGKRPGYSGRNQRVMVAIEGDES